MKCGFKPDCSEQIFAYCNECRPNIDLCISHFKQHFDEYQHSFTKYTVRNELPNRCEIVKNKIAECKKLIISETSKAVRLLTGNMKKLLKELKTMNSNINNLNDLTLFETNTSRSSELANSIKSLFQKSAENEKIYQGRCLFKFENSSNVLFSFDTEKLNFSCRAVSELEPQGGLATICQVSNEKLFYYGGTAKGYRLNTAFFINPISLSVKETESCIKRSCASGELANNRVYVFGGLNNNGNLSESHYFDLKTEKWVRIQNLPSASGFTNTLKVNKNILITSGSTKSLLTYSLESDKYEIFNPGIIIQPYSNVLIHYQDKVFLVTDTNIYFSSFNNLKLWTRVSSVNYSKIFDDGVTTRPIIRGDNAYFINHPLTVLCFNFTTYSISEVVKMTS